MDIKEVWEQLIAQLKSYPNVNASQIDAFFSRVQIQAVSSDFIMFTSNTSFIKDWIEKHYIKDIKQALLDIYGVEFMVQIEVDPTVPQASDTPVTPTTPLTPQPIQQIPNHTVITNPAITPPIHQTGYLEVNKTPAPVQNNQAEDIDSNLRIFTFDTFVIGNSNRMAYSMATEVAARPGNTDMNPLFIYGRSGVGKTHLMCAIQNYIKEQYPDLNVCYMDSMEMVNKYSDAAIEKSIDKQSFKNFEQFFEEADVLLIDDIQGLQDKPGTLSVFFRIFNTMINKGKQFVFSADRAPKNIDLDERYTSRFNSGATIDIQPPDNETKLNIIKNFIRQYEQNENISLPISRDILNYIVEHSSSNVRELKSAVTNVIFALKMNNGEELTPQRVKELLANHFISEESTRITIDTIQRAVEDFYSVSHSDLVGNKRSRKITHPRQVAIYLSRELIESSTFKSIGEEFNRDHSTIMHSYDLIKNALNEDRNLREEIEAIREKIRIQQY